MEPRLARTFASALVPRPTLLPAPRAAAVSGVQDEPELTTHTTNSSSTWKVMLHAADLGSIQLSDANHGWAFTATDEVAYRTTDGGQSWTELPLPPWDRYAPQHCLAFFFPQ